MTMALYMIIIIIVKARDIIHIAFRVHALSNVIKMLATSAATLTSAPSKRRSPSSRPSQKPYERNSDAPASIWRTLTFPAASVTCKRSPQPQLIKDATAITLPPNPFAINALMLSPVAGLHSNWRVMIPAVSSGHRVVDGYVRVGPNRWLRCGDVSGV